MAKKYYWLKLKEDFFDDDTIAYIEEQENGESYVNFYLKLCLKSLKTDGKMVRLVGDSFIPYDVNSLAKLTRTPPDTVRVAMELFQNIGLIKVLDTGELYLSQMNELIGSETDKAAIMRRKRAEEKALGNNVTAMLPKCYTEIEIEKELEIETDKDIDSRVEPESDMEDIIFILDHLNQKAGTHYRASSKTTKKYIRARLKEGFTLEDFKTVIDGKCNEWMGTDYQKYLRPTTLFGTKFEDYLNQGEMPETKKSKLPDIDNIDW